MRFEEVARQLCILFNRGFLLVYGGMFIALTFVAVGSFLVFPWFVAVSSLEGTASPAQQPTETIALIQAITGFLLAWVLCAATMTVSYLTTAALRVHTYPIPLPVLLSLCAPATLFFALEYVSEIAPLTRADGVLLFSCFIILCAPQIVFFILKNRTVIPTYMPEPDSPVEK